MTNIKSNKEILEGILASSSKVIPVRPVDRATYHKYLSQMLFLAKSVIAMRKTWLEWYDQVQNNFGRVANRAKFDNSYSILNRLQGEPELTRRTIIFEDNMDVVPPSDYLKYYEDRTQCINMLDRLMLEVTRIELLVTEFERAENKTSSRPLYSVRREWRSKATTNAVSLLLLFHEGKTSTTLADHKFLLISGTFNSWSDTARSVQIQLRQGVHLNPCVVRVSKVHGRRLIRTPSYQPNSVEYAHMNPNRDYDLLKSQKDMLMRHFGQKLSNKFVGYYQTSPHILNAVRTRYHKFAHNFVKKLEVTDCRPTVLPTGRPIKFNDTNWAIPCIWANPSDSWKQRREQPIVEGFILCRKGWSSCIHVETLPDAVNANRMMTLAMSSYGEGMRNHTPQQRRKIIGQALKIARQIDHFTPQDSYAVGNCVPGTASWMKDLGIISNKIDGKTLAKLWRRSGYTDPQRFIPVVKYCLQRMQAAAEAVKATIQEP
jgi:hypothetical protein